MAERVFPHPNLANDWHCSICKTNADAPVVLVPLAWTEQDGIVECKQVHQECWNLTVKMHDKARRHD